MKNYEYYVYYDGDTDPSNPGWVASRRIAGQGHWGAETEPLDAETQAEALREAAAHYGISAEHIIIED